MRGYLSNEDLHELFYRAAGGSVDLATMMDCSSKKKTPPTRKWLARFPKSNGSAPGPSQGGVEKRNDVRDDATHSTPVNSRDADSTMYVLPVRTYVNPIALPGWLGTWTDRLEVQQH